MDIVKVYRFRGKLFETEREARKHIDELIGEILCKHARQLCRIDKYSATIEYLENVIDDFQEVYLLKDDLRVIDRDQDDD